MFHIDVTILPLTMVAKSVLFELVFVGRRKELFLDDGKCVDNNDIGCILVVAEPFTNGVALFVKL
jgi:hypothetical protein